MTEHCRQYYLEQTSTIMGVRSETEEVVTTSESATPSCADEYQVDEIVTSDVGTTVYDGSQFDTISGFLSSRIERGLETKSFLMTNLSSIVSQYRQWKRELPMVDPFYAVKCCPDVAIVRLLAAMGCNFDCATMGEMDLVLNGLGEKLSFNTLGKASTSIVYANPAKMQHMLQFALDNNVAMTVFDGEDELLKIADILKSSGRPLDSFKLLLRLVTDDHASMTKFSKKFGCPLEEAPELLKLAQELGLHVAGVSFHVGSCCGDSTAHAAAINNAYRVFQAAEALGMPPMTIMDIGGGFPGDQAHFWKANLPSFSEIAAGIRLGIEALDKKLIAAGRSVSSIRFMAEPGRYFVSASTAIATKVYARKGGRSAHQALYVDNGVYGNFNNVIYDFVTPIPTKYVPSHAHAAADASATATALIPTAIFGPTCDGLDQMCNIESTMLERCEIGDWLLWENMGAYTHTASFVFNGYTHIPDRYHCFM